MSQTHAHGRHTRDRDEAASTRAHAGEKSPRWEALIGMPVGISETQVSAKGELSGLLTEEGARKVFEELRGKGAH